MENNSKRNILAKDYPLAEILGNKKYTVDYFQREYKWEKINIEQLVSDLVNAFMESYREGHKTIDVANYGTYYMGSIVLSEKGGTSSIIDGQQRITSLTLLLIYLYHATNKTMSEQLSNMIYSDSYGEKSFNIQVEEREPCLKALYETGEYTVKDTDDESTRHMAERYQDICDCFPRDLFTDVSLKSFVYWVKNNLILVKITAMSEENAYTIFETMNDRGVVLTSSDMLKGFILSKFSHDDKRKSVNAQWKKDMLSLDAFDTSTESQFFQSWFRAKYAVTIREGKANSVNMDFENIGARFHNWFKENIDKGLLSEAINGDIEEFIEKYYHFYLRQFIKIKNAELTYNPSLPHVYYLRFWGIAPSLSYPLFMAPLNVEDSEDVCDQKIEVVARHIDNFVVRRSVNYRLFSSNSIRYTMCNLVKTIRSKSIEDLKTELKKSTEQIDDFAKAMPRFRLHGQNGRFVKYLLARITSYIEESCGMSSNFVVYMTNPDCKPYEIEHIWSDHYEWHTDEFDQTDKFNETRNSIGDLVLLPNGVNQSLNDLETAKKLPHYIKENILAKSLCEQTYEKNPSFLSFVKDNNLSFKSYDDIKKDDITDRCKLYAELADLIWNRELD